jgi:hypothetical protein
MVGTQVYVDSAHKNNSGLGIVPAPTVLANGPMSMVDFGGGESVSVITPSMAWATARTAARNGPAAKQERMKMSDGDTVLEALVIKAIDG